MNPPAADRSCSLINSSSIETPAVPTALVDGRSAAEPRLPEPALETVVEHVLDDCFLAVGQVVGMRKTVDYDAVLWWRDHFRVRFLAAMKGFGNRWVADREVVTAVALMLGERAVRYAGDRPSIGLDAARLATADVERYCHVHAARRAAARRRGRSEERQGHIAGYWCIDNDVP